MPLRVFIVCGSYLLLWAGCGAVGAMLGAAPWTSPWYPGHALSLALIAVFGPRYLPLLFVVRLLAGAFLVAEPLATTLVAGVASVASYGLAGWFLYVRRIDRSLGTTSAAARFLALGTAAALVLAAIVGPVLVLTGATAPQDLMQRAIACAIGDSLAIFGLGPVFLRAAAWGAHALDGTPSAARGGSGTRYGLVATLAAVTLLTVAASTRHWHPLNGTPIYLVAIPVIWAAFAFGSAGAAAVVAAVNLGVPFAQQMVGATLPVQDTQLLLAVVSVMGILLGAATCERRSRAAELAAQREELERSAIATQRLCDIQSTLARAETIAGIGSYRADLRTGEVWWSDELFRMLRLDPATFGPGGDHFAQLAHPDDREGMLEIVRRIRDGTQPPGPILNTLRMIRGDGVIRHMRLAREVAYGPDGKISHVTGIVEDVTEEIETRRALADTEAHLSAVAANVPGMVFRCVQHGGGGPSFTYVSDGVRCLSGLEPDEVIRHADLLLDRIHPDDRTAFDSAMREAARAASPWRVVFRIAGAAEELWVYWAAQTRRRADGVIEWDGVLLDVTAEKSAERELSRNEERFRFMTALAPMALALIGRKDGRVRYANSACEQMFGYSAGGMADIPVSRLMSDSATMRSVGHELDRVSAIMQREIAFRRRDGSRFSGLFSFMRASAPDDDEIVACGLDVSELKNVQEALARQSRDLEEQVRELHCRYLMSRLTHDRERGVGQICRELLDVLPQGWPHADRLWMRLTVRGETYTTGVRGDRKAFARAPILAGSELVGEIELGARDGDFVPPPPASEEHDLLGSAARQIGHMIFEREASASLVQAQRLESIGQLSGGIAHDFNNLLTVVFGNLELAEDHARDDVNLRKCLANAQQAARRAAGLTNQLLAFSRRQTLSPAPVELNELIGGIVGPFRRTLGEGIEVVTELEAGLLRVHVDRAQMEVALLNLAVNARDAMPGGGRLSIATREVEVGPDDLDELDGEAKPGHYVELTIADTGDGMPPEVLGRVFDPFFTTKGVGRGAGLGLSAVFGFVKQSGGLLTVSSEVGEGTTFHVRLPVAAGTDASARATVSTTMGEPPHDDACILVVEDEPQVLDYVARCLRLAGYRAITAPNGREALAVLDGGCLPDLLLTDVGLSGGMDGPALARAARERDPGLKVLYASGYAYDALVASGAIGGGVPLIFKPFVRHDLLARVRSALDGEFGVAPGAIANSNLAAAADA